MIRSFKTKRNTGVRFEKFEDGAISIQTYFLLSPEEYERMNFPCTVIRKSDKYVYICCGVKLKDTTAQQLIPFICAENEEKFNDLMSGNKFRVSINKL